MNLEKALGRLPGFKVLFAKFAAQDSQMQQIEYENLLLAQELIDNRLRRKKETGEKINVVFICHRPPVWESLHSVYNELKEDQLFDVRIVAIPNKKQLPDCGLNHEEYESEGAEDFWNDYGCLNGYNYQTREWLDLRELNPDYVFFQTPYNITRPPAYSSAIVSKYAKIGYVAYFSPISVDDTYEESTPLNYLKDLAFFFTQHEDDNAFIRERYKKINLHLCRQFITGNPRFDRVNQYRNVECRIWNSRDSFKILWTPRWTTNEGNCHFFTYRDRFTAYCRNNKQVELTFRPHPQAFREWNATGEMKTEEQEQYRKLFQNSNMHLDESREYYPLLFSSDCLVTDRSTLIIDYLCTHHPIVYCTSNGIHDEVIPGIGDALYKAGNWEELTGILEDLQQGKDPLRMKREKTITEYLKVGKIKAGERIRDILRADALK